MKKIFAVLLCAIAVLATTTTLNAETTVKLSFRNADDTKAAWPFAEKKFSKDAGVTEAKLTLKKTGHAFAFESSSPMYLNSKVGFMFGGEAGNCITLPAVKGKTLTKVTIKFGGKGGLGAPCVTDHKGKLLDGGKAAKSPALDAVHTWEVYGLKKSKAAKLMLTMDGMLKVKSLELTYE